MLSILKNDLSCYENRKIDVLTYQNNLQKNFYIFPPISCIKFIQKFGDLKYIDHSSHLMYKFLCDYSFLDPHIFEENMKLNRLKFAPIGIVVNHRLGRLTLIMNEKEEIYILESNQKIANDTQSFFQLIFSENMYIRPVINKNTIPCLKEVGWYPARKCDVSNFIHVLNNAGYIVFKSAIDFFGEFYGLNGITPTEKKRWKILNEKDIIDGYTPDFLDDTDFRPRYPKGLYLPICEYYNHDMEVSYYITENGKFVTEEGTLCGNNAIEFFNTLFRY